jgi:alpha-L-fucosidase
MTCAHNGGNLLLNIGPKGDGSVPVPSLDILRDVRAWLDRNGVAIFGTQPHPFNYADQKLSTGKDNMVYVALHWYHGSETVVGGVGNRVLSVRTLAGNRSVAFRQENDRVQLVGLPAASPDPLLCVVEIEVDGFSRGVPFAALDPSRYLRPNHPDRKAIDCK